MNGAEMDAMREDIRYIREQMDMLKSDVTDLKVTVEHRVTRLEVKTTLMGTIGGFVAGWLAKLLA